MLEITSNPETPEQLKRKQDAELIQISQTLEELLTGKNYAEIEANSWDEIIDQ